MVRTVSALMIFVLGMWMFFTISYAVGYAMAQGSREWNDLSSSPLFLLRFCAALLVCLGGALSFRRDITGAMVSGLAAAAIGALAILLFLRGYGEDVWRVEALNTVILIVFTSVYVVFHRE